MAAAKSSVIRNQLQALAWNGDELPAEVGHMWDFLIWFCSSFFVGQGGSWDGVVLMLFSASGAGGHHLRDSMRTALGGRDELAAGRGG